MGGEGVSRQREAAAAAAVAGEQSGHFWEQFKTLPGTLFSNAIHGRLVHTFRNA